MTHFLGILASDLRKCNLTEGSCIIVAYSTLSSKLTSEKFSQLQIQQLCETLPRTHFLGILASDLRKPNFSKGSSIILAYSTLSSKLTFENFSQLQIQRLCETFPMTHFLGILAFDLARVRTSAEYCREQGISLNGAIYIYMFF